MADRRTRARRVVRAGMILTALVLAGCGDKEGGGNNSTEAATTASTSVDENLYQDQQNRAVPIAVPSARPAGAIPASFRGRWALTAADCDPSRADNKGLMVVEPTLLRFYESRAAVVRATETGGDRLTLRLSFSGEGQQWTADQTLTLLDEGRTLVRDEPSPPTSLRYARCPA